MRPRFVDQGADDRTERNERRHHCWICAPGSGCHPGRTATPITPALAHCSSVGAAAGPRRTCTACCGHPAQVGEPMVLQKLARRRPQCYSCRAAVRGRIGRGMTAPSSSSCGARSPPTGRNHDASDRGWERLPNQGQESSRQAQYCGQLGKTANCQAACSWRMRVSTAMRCWIVACICRRSGSTRPYADRRTACGVPDACHLHDQPSLSLAMLQAVVQAGTVPANGGRATEAFATHRAAGSDCRPGQMVLHGSRARHARWRERPATVVPPWSGRGRKPTREQCSGRPAALTVAELRRSCQSRRGRAS